MKFVIILSMLFSATILAGEKTPLEDITEGTVVAAGSVVGIGVMAIPIIWPAEIAIGVPLALAGTAGYGVGKVIRGVDKGVGKLLGEDEGYLTKGVSYLGEKSGVFPAVHNALRDGGKENDKVVGQTYIYLDGISSATVTQ